VHPLVKLAIRSVKYFIETGNPLPCPAHLPDFLRQSAGIFVSIKKQGSLRGCIGTITPKYKNLAEEVIQNALRSASEDPRFDPIQKKELPSLTFSVDVMKPLEKIDSIKDQNIKQFGLVIRGEGKQSVLLPDLDIIKSADQQLQVCLKKGGFKWNDTYEIFRFEVKRFV